MKQAHSTIVALKRENERLKKEADTYYDKYKTNQQRAIRAERCLLKDPVWSGFFMERAIRKTEEMKKRRQQDLEDAAIQQAEVPVEAAGENPAQQAEVIDVAEGAAAEHRDMEAFVRWVDVRVHEENIAPLAIVGINNFWHHEMCPCWQCGGDYGILYDD